MLSMNFLKYGDGIPFSEYLKSRRKEKKSKRKKSETKRKKSKKTKRLKRPKSKRPKRHKSKKKQRHKVPPSGVIIRKNDKLFKSDGQNLKLIE
jgi:hypothetical protein